jgi:hypothetical protein
MAPYFFPRMIIFGVVMAVAALVPVSKFVLKAGKGTAKKLYGEPRDPWQPHKGCFNKTKQNKTKQKRAGQSGDALLFFCALRLVGFVRPSLQEQKGHQKKRGARQ